ncbi:MAG: hypothetical protein M3Q10_13840 [Chloroflexota bacterium]|nr:hypothetical protein [Chloroflexota bacterium]
MAVTDAGRDAAPKPARWWLREAARARRLHARYNPAADELVVRFARGIGPVVTVAIQTRDRDYAHLLMDDATGEVVGIQIDNLLASAVRLHPGWRLLAWPDEAERGGGLYPFLTDVAKLHEGHGTSADDLDRRDERKGA